MMVGSPTLVVLLEPPILVTIVGSFTLLVLSGGSPNRNTNMIIGTPNRITTNNILGYAILVGHPEVILRFFIGHVNIGH